MVRRIVGTITLAILLSPAALAAQSGSIRGSVTDTAGTPLSNASVTIEGTGLRTTTGTSGTYEIRGVPAGSHPMRARSIGYQSASARVEVAGGEEVQHDFELSRSTVRLAPIDVVVGSRGR